MEDDPRGLEMLSSQLHASGSVTESECLLQVPGTVSNDDRSVGGFTTQMGGKMNTSLMDRTVRPCSYWKTLSSVNWDESAP